MNPTDYSGRLQQAIDDAEVTVRELANHLGITTQAIYKVLRRDTKALQASHHLRASKFLGVDPAWLSDGAGKKAAKGPISLTNNPDYPAVPKVKISFSAGVTGYHVDRLEPTKADPLVFRAAWFQERGLKPERLVAVGVSGDSMEPTLYDGDTIVINLDAKAPVDSAVFALRFDDELVVKRLFKGHSGDWEVHSDNADKRRFPNRGVGAHVEIIGRVVHRQSERL